MTPMAKPTKPTPVAQALLPARFEGWDQTPKEGRPALPKFQSASGMELQLLLRLFAREVR